MARGKSLSAKVGKERAAEKGRAAHGTKSVGRMKARAAGLKKSRKG